MQGRRVATLQRGVFEGGTEVEATWRGTRDSGVAAPNGVYFARVAHAGWATAVKLVLAR